MASNYNVIYTARDRQILAALARTPLTAAQLRAYSDTFDRPFTSDRPLRRRMQLLKSAGWIHCYHYATCASGKVNYYRLTQAGYRLLNSPKAPLPNKSFFRPVSMALQEHTRALADFIVRTTVAAHLAGVTLASFYRENDLRLCLDNDRLQPDCAFQLTTGSHQFNYLVELDNGTEPVYSRKEHDSLAKKISFYDRYQCSCPRRFRVLTLFTKTGARHRHFLALAGQLVSNPDRRLFYAANLPDYLEHHDPLLSPLFLDHQSCRHALVPARTVSLTREPPRKLLDPTRNRLVL